MSARRLEKLAKIIQTTVSEVIQNHLSDPRITGLISVTRVQVSPDLRLARVYLSLAGTDAKQENLTLQAVKHARGFIQTRLADTLTTRTCPRLDFQLDESIKKGFAITHILDQIAAEHTAREGGNPPESPLENPESNDER